ncbi:SPOR domain-containing protein [Novosphingobium sp. B 225]|uniref:SPOR domain-containing protein n=1 Tax=Novosphingobium sp. B 225 TaxID=1961849 RepID=UPI0011250C98|nr:SPOR domain-containing protein [Novosphingobium sp. B 225]
MNLGRQAAVRLTRLIGLGAIVCAGMAGQGALAQQDDVDEVSQPVVQAIPGGKGMKLNDALGRLARNPQDVDALIGAGRASMEIGDLDAAVGFFQRADRLAPGNARVKAGLAGAFALSEDPFTAIPLFVEAEKAGMIDPALQADRGLAYDLVGDNATAQKYYRASLAAGPSDEALRRLALSQAIAGDRRGMEVTLSPLLQRQDMAAWRTRAFGLAILGQKDEAESIARANLPGTMADSISNYLAYMPRLTASQKAAAANLGHFPRASQIGIDDPRVAVFRPKPPVLAAASVPAVPAASTARKGKAGRDKAARTDPAPAAVKPPVLASAAPSPPPVSREVTKAPVTLAVNTPPPPSPVPSPVLQSAPAVVAPPPAAAPRVLAEAAAPVAVAVPPPAQPGPGFAALDSAAAQVAPGFDLKPSTPPPAPVAAPPPPPPAPATPAPAKPRNLADLFADLTPPSREAEPKAGAVDIRRIGPVRPAADKAAKDAKLALADDCTPDPKGAKPAKGAKAAPVSRTAKGAAAAKACPVEAKDAKGKSPAASQPSRIWIQLATGRDKSALGFDWRRMVKEEPEILGKYKAATSAWGASNRLLAGPFASESAASAVVARLKKAGIGGAFVWTSPAGQVVDPLGGAK